MRVLKIVIGIVLILSGGYVIWNRENPPISSFAMDASQAQNIINDTEDKSQVPREIWLASGLSDLEYKVLWNQGTERAGTGDLLNEKRKGVFVSKGCKVPVFSSEHKFESGTGWPSFWDVLDKDNVVLKEDNKFGWKRTEILSSCGEHLGHVFSDGPDPTGLRYCINSAALEFIPEENE